MARKYRRRIKFSPFRIPERLQKSILVALGVFLMVIFAVPFAGPCERRGAMDPGRTWATLDGERITYGEVSDHWRRWARVFSQQLSELDVQHQLALLHEARRAGIRISDAEVEDAVYNYLFPRRAQVEYVIAETSEAEKKLDASVPKAQRAQEAARKALEALVKLKQDVDAIVGADLEGALKRLATERGLTCNTTRPFTVLEAREELHAIVEAPGIERRAFTQPIGELSEPLQIAGGYCMFRVVLRTRGFDTTGLKAPYVDRKPPYVTQREGWGGQGYGPLGVRKYADTLRERGITQTDLEQTIREQLAIERLQRLLLGATGQLAQAVVRDRYTRDNTQAVAAYFALRTSDFTDVVRYTDEALRAFYEEHKGDERTDARVGYRRPPRARIEYILGRTDDVERALDESRLQWYYERDRAQFPGTDEEALPKLRRHAAQRELELLINELAQQAADKAGRGEEPDFEAMAREESATKGGAFVYGVTSFFSAQDADAVAPELKGGKLGEILFGQQGQYYAVKGEEPKEGQHAISSDFACDAGRFFFRVLDRVPGEEVQYDDISEDTRTQLRKDYAEHEAFRTAQQKAAEYRKAVYQDALQQLARKLGVQPVTTEFLTAQAPVPPVGKPLPALYGELAAAEVGDLSRAVAEGDQLVLARLADRQLTAGLKLEILVAPAKSLGDGFEPSTFDLQTTYDADPYRYLDQPMPIPFDAVRPDIEKLLARRRAADLGAERVAAAIRDLAGAEKPDLAAAAGTHKLTPYRDVRVDFARTEAASPIGKAAGFHDAVTALKPGEVSRALTGADGCFVFVVKARDDKGATLDVAAALHDKILPEIKVEEKDARQYYDANRDTAYVTNDEIKPPPPWGDLPEPARDRVRTELREAWQKKPPLDRFAELRNACVQEAFRTVPARTPLTTTRPVRLEVITLPPFPLSKPRGVLEREPGLLEAVSKLSVGEIAEPVAAENDVFLPLLAARKPGGEATVSLAIFNAPDFLDVTTKPSDEALQRYYEDNKADFLIPESAVVECLFADETARRKAIQPKLSDNECRRYYEQHRGTLYTAMTYEQAKDRARGDLARERADREALQAADAAFEALRKNPEATEAEINALATRHQLTHTTSRPFALRDPVELPDIGRVPGLAADLRLAKPGELVPRVVPCADGYLVCRLVRRDPARIPTLDEARESVVRAVRLQQAREAARQAAEKFHAAAAQTSFDKAEAELTGTKPEVLRNFVVTAPGLMLPRNRPAPALADAIFALDKPGFTPAITEHEAACSCVAYVAERKPDQLLEVKLVTIRRWEVAARGFEPTDEELRAHYEAHKDRFRVPDQLQIEYLAVTYKDLARTLTASDEELQQEYDRSVKAGETLYRDFSKPGRPFHPFEEAKDKVRQQVIASKAKAEAGKLLADALEALRTQGAAADFKAYAAKVPALQQGLSPFLEREADEVKPVGRAPELVKQAFAAKDGELGGPVFGPDGACIFRRAEFRPAHLPPLEEKRFAVEVDLRRQREIDRAVELARSLREKVAPLVAKAEDKGQAFETAVEAEPLTIEIPQAIRVTVTRPFYPLDAGWARPSFIAGLGQKPALVRAIFRADIGSLTPVVDDPDRSACYVATPARFLAPGKATEQDLEQTQFFLARLTGFDFQQSWRMYLGEKIEPSR